MKNRRLAALLAAWAVAMTALVAFVATLFSVVPTVPNMTHEDEPPLGSPVAFDRIDLGASAAQLRDRNPFRMARRPTDVRFDPWKPVDTVVHDGPASVRVSRPTLVLNGILGGPPWNALVEGIPGRSGGLLLRLGEQANGVRFSELRGDTVLLAGLDTTWALTTRRIGR